MYVETECASEKLVNQRLAYVAVSRGQYDARIYTDDRVKLPRVLDRDGSHPSALDLTPPARRALDRLLSPAILHTPWHDMWNWCHARWLVSQPFRATAVGERTVTVVARRVVRLVRALTPKRRPVIAPAVDSI